MRWLQTIQKLRRPHRLTPQDGMPLTLETWNAAHDYHRGLQQATLLLTRGWGVLAGLTLSIDNQNPRLLHVSPGVAIDPLGQLLHFDGDTVKMQGGLNTSRLLDVGVVRITLQATQAQMIDKPYHAKESAQLLLEMANTTPSEAVLELARVDLTAIDATLKWPVDPHRPGKDEIDQRFRLLITPQTPVAVALVKLDDSVADDHLQGWRALAREVTYTTARPILIDEWDEQTLPTLETLKSYAMVCLVGRDNFVQEHGKRRSLIEYVADGGILFYESCRQNQNRASLRLFASAEDQPFHDWTKQLGTDRPLEFITNGELFVKNHSLSRLPYLFRQPPRGYAEPSTRQFQVIRGVGKGLILYSNQDYGCAFYGQFANNNQPTRSEVRETLEWGHNLLALAGNYAL